MQCPQVFIQLLFFFCFALNDGEFACRFRKVMPIDYKRVLTVIKQAKLEGLNEEQTVDRIMEAARG